LQFLPQESEFDTCKQHSVLQLCELLIEIELLFSRQLKSRQKLQNCSICFPRVFMALDTVLGALFQNAKGDVRFGYRAGGQRVSAFKWRHFEGVVILWAVRWYCRYGISYRDLEQMMGERGVSIDHSTIYRWVQTYAPEMERRLRWQWRCPQSASWRVDETYVKVRGQWAYLYRALDKHGNTIDFYLSPTRNAKAAKRFLGKALNGLKPWERPEIVNTDKAPTYAIAIA
jgi:transposase, IS6 family